MEFVMYFLKILGTGFIGVTLVLAAFFLQVRRGTIGEGKRTKSDVSADTRETELPTAASPIRMTRKPRPLKFKPQE
jgi:hypothetical protein